MNVAPVAGALGAEVRGVDLETIADDEFDRVLGLLDEHLVLFFPDQRITPDGHRAFGRRFGEIEIHPFLPKLDDAHPEIIVLDGDKGGRADIFHTDVTWSETPPIASVLHMVTTPTRGGDTIWTNQYLVYEALSAPMRDLLDGLTAVHTARTFGHPEQQAEHPAVRVHPNTSRRSLYVNRQFTSHFPQLHRTESDALLALLHAHSEQPQFQCRYRWSEGTVGIWDNRCTQHYAVNDYDEPRLIQRVTILGDLPVGDPPRWPHWEPGGALSAATAAAAGLLD